MFYEFNWTGDTFLTKSNLGDRVGGRAFHGFGIELSPLPQLRVGVELRNASDDQTPDVLGFPLPGRSFFATVSWGFGRES